MHGLIKAAESPPKRRRRDENYRIQIAREQARMRHMWHIIQSADISELSLEGIETLRQLDKRRRDCQTAIINGNRNGGEKACALCKGFCCHFGHKSLYYSVDVWLRRYTDKPVPSQEEIAIRHPIAHFYSSVAQRIRRWLGELYQRAVSRIKGKLPNHLKNLLKRAIGRTDQQTELKPIKEQRVERGWIPCKCVTDRGCILDSSDRPITCIVATCNKYIDALDEKSLALTARNFEALRIIHQDLLRLLKKEKKIGKLKGLTRLALSSLPFGPPEVIHKTRSS